MYDALCNENGFHNNDSYYEFSYRGDTKDVFYFSHANEMKIQKHPFPHYTLYKF